MANEKDIENDRSAYDAIVNYHNNLVQTHLVAGLVLLVMVFLQVVFLRKNINVGK